MFTCALFGVHYLCDPYASGEATFAFLFLMTFCLSQIIGPLVIASIPSYRGKHRS